MQPVLFHIGSIPIFSYGLFVILGLALLFLLTARLSLEAGRKTDYIFSVGAGVFVGAILGARLFHLIVEPHRTRQLLDFYTLFFQPGTPGNILGIMLGGYWGGMAVRQALGAPSIGNFFAPGLAAASVVWRLGCTFAGCCHGTPTDLPWAIVIDGTAVHPTMIYELLLNLTLFFAIWKLQSHITKDNALLYLYFLVYTIVRFFLEYIRIYPRLYGGLTGIQVICIAVWIWLAIWWLWQARRPQEPAEVVEATP